MNDFHTQRLGLVMEPQPGNPIEAEGVLNPAAARGPDSQLHLFPPLVSRGNYSRIGIARVRFGEDGDPLGVERSGIALEPEAEYERRVNGDGVCEDTRVTFVEDLHRYVMTYTALSICRASSRQLTAVPHPWARRRLRPTPHAWSRTHDGRIWNGVWWPLVDRDLDTGGPRDRGARQVPVEMKPID